MASSSLLEPSLSALTRTTPIKNNLCSHPVTSTVATPDQRQVRTVKSKCAAFNYGFGSDLHKLNCGVASKDLPFLPQMNEILCEFFNAMVSSIRLFRVRRLSSTFPQLSRNIESLTKRRFTVNHLAQLKHIVPEVIVVKKIRVQDWETKCMKEELLVSLEEDSVTTFESINGGARFSELKGIFQSRLADYFQTHDKEEDVPEAELPKLFYQPKQEPEPTICITPSPVALSHTSPSFKRIFSCRAPDCSVSESSQAELSSHMTDTPMTVAIATASVDEANAPPVRCVSTPAKLISTPEKLNTTPAKLVSTPERLMVATPSLVRPKRPLNMMTPDHDCSRDIHNRSAKRRGRALNFDHISNDIDDLPSLAGEEEASLAAQDSKDHLQSFSEKEPKTLEEQDPVVSRDMSEGQLMAGVISLFDMIRHLFQSIRRSAFTKGELIYKLIASHLDIIDRREVEKQLELLQEVAPECISEVQSISGDTLLRLNKSSCPESIRMKLLEV